MEKAKELATLLDDFDQIRELRADAARNTYEGDCIVARDAPRAASATIRGQAIIGLFSVVGYECAAGTPRPRPETVVGAGAGAGGARRVIS